VHPVGSIRSGSGQSPSPATGQETPRCLERQTLDVRNVSSEAKISAESSRLMPGGVLLSGLLMHAKHKGACINE
jgi:hypothetical protein